MNLYDATVPVFTKLLTNMDKWLDKAVAYAEQRKFDPEVLLSARLAPDQFAFARQVQASCDHAKLTVARLTGKEAPAHPDTEKTIPELRARIKAVIDYLATFKPDDFAGSEDRAITTSRWQGKTMRGGDYLDHFALPQLHFHLTTTYAILRHNGVDVGKRDYLGDLPLKG
jgi:uncharacterized protein